MRVLGIEGTAWAASAALYDSRDGSVILESDPYTPDAGGIHPREAAEHMASAIPTVIQRVLDAGGSDIDAVAFSQGPGLGPCLRIVATAARTLAQRESVPLVGVNHMIAHLEVGRTLGGFDDPICLNASGANAHVLGFHGDRYRVLGETMDTGVGNAIDKFTRHLGWSHPGGPRVEEKALDGDYLPLPYVVKGMDFSFAGITSAAIEAIERGESIADVCFALQETIFAMLTEVTERALSLTGRNEVVLGGGVGQNSRLQEMLSLMCAERGATIYVPPDEYLRDNAAMIAMLGETMHRAGDHLALEDSAVRSKYRPDQVPVSWREPSTRPLRIPQDNQQRGAEAIVRIVNGSVRKHRISKSYRHPVLDQSIRRERTATEARLLAGARKAGVPTPVIQDINLRDTELQMEHVGDTDLREHVTKDRVRAVGGLLARIHAADIIHGDPTTRNIRIAEQSDGERLYLIDFGLGYYSGHIEDQAMDLHIFLQSLTEHAQEIKAFRPILSAGYRDDAAGSNVDAAAVLTRLGEIDERGRYQ